jgi:hypothetical protein
MFKMKVKVSKRNVPTLLIERIKAGKNIKGIEIPDTYLASIENARKAEDRAVCRLALWIANQYPEVYEKQGLAEFVEDK